MTLMTGAEAQAAAVRAARTSIISNTCLTLVKALAGIFTGSVSIMSEALHSGLDLAAAFEAKMAKNEQKYPADQYRGRFGPDDPGLG